MLNVAGLLRALADAPLMPGAVSDGNEYVFMDKEDYTPYTFTKDQIEEELLFMPEGGMPDMQVLTWDGQLLALELPQTVDLEIVETAPGIKGASASARNKPATLSTGGTAGSGRLNINILNQQQFAVVIQYHTFFNFVRSWHRKIPVVENVKNIATKYSRRAFRASGIRTFAGAKKVVLCALINPVVNLKRTTYEMPSGLRGVLHCPFNFQPYSRYARWQARQYALHSA